MLIPYGLSAGRIKPARLPSSELFVLGKISDVPQKKLVTNIRWLSLKCFFASSNTNCAVQSTCAFTFPYKGLDKGSRAFRAFVRPSPTVIAGKPKQYGFDVESGTFTLRMIPFQPVPPDDAPTEIFLPAYLFHDGKLNLFGFFGPV